MTITHKNQFWKSHDKHSQKDLFESPKAMLQAAYEYFDWCDKHTWYKQEAVKSGQGAGTIISVPVARPYSLGGLCIHLGCSQHYFNKFKESCSNEFIEVVGRIENIIETQLFEGVSLGMFNSTASNHRTSAQEHSKSSIVKDSTLNIEVIDGETKRDLELLCENLAKN